MEEGGAGTASATAPAAAKVRVVRCPKCQKLLPELAGFTVYRCGGCDATLQAKHAIPIIDTSSEKSDEERVVISENPECCSDNRRITSNLSSENDLESDKSEFMRKQRVVTGNPNGSTSHISGSRGASKEPGESRLDDLRGGSRHRDGRDTCSSKAPADVCNGGVDEMGKANVEDIQNRLQGERAYKPQKVQNNPIYKDEEKDGLGVLRRTPRTLLEGSRFSPYSHEGPSSSHPASSYGYRDDGHVRHQSTDRSERVETLEQDRADLLRKLDELRDQLSRSCDIKGKSNDRDRDTMNRTASSNPYSRQGQGTWFENSSMNRTSARQFPLFNGHNVDMQNFYTPPHVQNEVLGFGDPFESQQLRRAPFHPSHQYPQRATEGYMYGQFDPDPVISYPHNVFYHQPACSCPHCCSMHWQASVQDSQPVFSNQRAPYLANGHGLYPLSNSFMLGSSSYNHRASNGSLLSREPRIHQRSVLAKRGHSCKPIAGGAPFIVCNNCSELLQVPQKLSSVGKNLYKLRCGSCSQVISFKIEGKRLDISSPPSVLNTSLEPMNNSAEMIAQGLQCPGPSNHGLVNSYSGDYESPSCNIQSTDEKLILSPPLPAASHETIEKEYGLNLSESENMMGLSSSPSSSDDNESTESMVCQREAPSSTELQSRTKANSRGPGLPLREHFGYPSSDQAVSRPGEGSRSERFDQEKMVATNGNFKQNSIKDVSITSEIDLATEKYPNPGLLQDCMEVSKEEDHPLMSKGGDSFFTGLIKKSFKDFPRFNQSLEGSKSKVSINGHHIPDRLVKKAEKLAGPIHPGEYWYDYGAGFWGVIGQPCLGIIPPFIEEFNYPMPKNCSGGNTGITVNGRELHQKDLDLLAGRGLPSDSGRSYCIDIFGRVLDEVSGEELDSLGKLAPTVEKLKRGFGLRAPRVLAG